MTHKRFGVVLRGLLIERGVTTKMGNPAWALFARTLRTMQYETLRKAVNGERPPSPELMDEVAAALGVDPAETFIEYALWAARREFDPREVGYDRAGTVLQEWNSFLTRVPSKEL